MVFRFLAVLFIIIILLLNVVGLLLYRKRRQRFFNQSNQINNTILMRETSTISTINVNKSKYRQLSVPSTIISDFSLTNTQSCPSSYLTNPLHKITTIRELNETIQLEEINELSLEEFRRQALKEHNSVRSTFNKSPLKLSESLNISAQVIEFYLLLFNIFIIDHRIGLNNVHKRMSFFHHNLNGVCNIKNNH